MGRDGKTAKWGKMGVLRFEGVSLVIGAGLVAEVAHKGRKGNWGWRLLLCLADA